MSVAADQAGGRHRAAAVLIGPPGAGKSTVGPLLAAMLGTGFTDTDAAVAAVAGKPVSDIFIEDGEHAFRALERAAVARAVASGDGVIAVGGGAVLEPATRQLLGGQPVVYLETGFTEAARRVGLSQARPLLIGNPRAKLRELLDQRLPVYRSLATITVSTDGRDPAEIAADIASQLRAGQATSIPVGGEKPYQVLVGAGIAAELPRLIGDRARAVMIIYASGTEQLTGPARAALAGAGYAVHCAPVPDGEAAKDLAVAAELWSALAAARLTRTDAIVGIGGGAVTDLAGFVAASWLRGVRVVLLPTTLLGMVDAAIGGKTGVNISAGKNLVGAFHPPAGVLADTRALATLPQRQYASGLAEVIKAGFIADPVILELIEAGPRAAAAPGGPHERELIERAVRMKAAVVAADLREAGQREMLNYGHTLGHAVEHAEHYRIPHGEAVAVGMVFAAQVARLAGLLDAATAARHRDILAAAGLPVSYHAGRWPQLREAMAVDKKSRGEQLRLVVLAGLAKPQVLAGPAEDLLAQAYAEVCR